MQSRSAHEMAACPSNPATACLILDHAFCKHGATVCPYPGVNLSSLVHKHLPAAGSAARYDPVHDWSRTLTSMMVVGGSSI